MRDNYVFRALWDAPKTILGGIFLFISAAVFAQFIFALGQAWVEGMGLPMYAGFDFLFDLLFAFGLGALSGIGLIFLGLDFWYIYRLMYRDEAAHTFFFVIAANQIGLCLCAALIEGLFLQALPGCIVALILIGFLYYITKKLGTNFLDRSPNGAN